MRIRQQGTVVRRFVVVLTFAGLVAAGLGAVPAAAGGGNLKRFCTTYLAINKAFNTAFVNEEPPVGLNRLLDRATDTAPPEIADAVDVVVPAYEADIEAAGEDPEVNAAVDEIDAFAAEECADERIDVTLEEYAFDGIPDEIDRGTVAFDITNEGTEVHELTVLRFKGDATLDDVVEAGPEELEDLVRPVPVAFGFAPPGVERPVVVALKKAGRYVALCYLPVGATSPEEIETLFEAGAVSHYTEGMAAEFEVVK